MTEQKKKQFSFLLEELGKSLDISEDQYQEAVRSYQSVAKWLAEELTPLAPFSPEIQPQGSFLLGTMIRPWGREDELDIDLVCKLLGKAPDWVQYNLKQKVGDRLKDHETYKKMLGEEGRRCWTLNYADSSKFHMDILPALVGKNHKLILEKAFADFDKQSSEELIIRITDKKETNYYSETDPFRWPNSNPFGYAGWFQSKASFALMKAKFLSESIKPVPTFQKNKLPLQRIIQILKRHRDMMFEGDEHKPISIIITTLAANAYQKETDIIEGLTNVVKRMPQFIEPRYDPATGKVIKWVVNPVNPEENFADKWPETPIKETNFYSWHRNVQEDIAAWENEIGMSNIKRILSKSFGEKYVNESFEKLGENTHQLISEGKLHMADSTGVLGATGTLVKKHTFHGKD